MTYPVDMEANFRPSPTDPNWLSNTPRTTRALTYGMQGRQIQTISDAYGADVTVPFTNFTVEPISVLVGAVIGVFGVVCFQHCKKKGYF